MDRFEAYSFLLSDTIFGNILLYAHSEFVLYAMKRLGGYKSEIILAIAVLGFSISVIFNYFCGAALYKLYKASVDEEKRVNYQKFHSFFQQYGIYLLCSNIIPVFGGYISLLAGFASFGLWRSLVIAVASKVIYYIYYIYL